MRSIPQILIPSTKTPLETPVRASPRGGYLKSGNPGNKGGGRKPDEFKQLCRELVSADKTIENVQAILQNLDHPQFMAALRWASENGYGKPTQAIDHMGTIRHGVVILPAVGRK